MSTLSSCKVVPHPGAHLGIRKSREIIKIGTNGVAMARHGLLLRVHGAMGGRMLLEALPGRFDGKTGSTQIRNVEKPESWKLPINRASGRYVNPLGCFGSSLGSLGALGSPGELRGPFLAEVPNPKPTHIQTQSQTKTKPNVRAAMDDTHP